jgi:hypothetical protein
MTQESFEYDREQNKINYEANIIGDIETLISVMENEDEFVYDRVSSFFERFWFMVGVYGSVAAATAEDWEPERGV